MVFGGLEKGAMGWYCTSLGILGLEYLHYHSIDLSYIDVVSLECTSPTLVIELRRLYSVAGDECLVSFFILSVHLVTYSFGRHSFLNGGRFPWYIPVPERRPDYSSFRLDASILFYFTHKRHQSHRIHSMSLIPSSR